MAKSKSLQDQVEKGADLFAPARESGGLAARVEKTKTRNYLLDLRIHSPSALGYLKIDGIDTAPALIRLAKVKGLDMIAVTDFYDTGFIDRAREAAQSSPVTVLPGVMIRCALGACDEVMLNCLFPESCSTAAIREFLAQLGVPAAATGRREYIVKRSLAEVISCVDACNAVCIPSRMDKNPTRAAAIPRLVEEYGFRTFDLVYPETMQLFRSRWPRISFNLLSFSNACALAQVGSRYSRVKMPGAGFDGLKAFTARTSQSAY